MGEAEWENQVSSYGMSCRDNSYSIENVISGIVTVTTLYDDRW